jgi:Universal stress protein UspA and related nucleotide-binding proteins
MFQRILFPVDFSASCIAMAPYVKRVETIFRANVTLVHICDLASNNGFELYARRPDEIAEDHWNLAQDKLKRFLDDDFPPDAGSRLLLAGDPGQAITSVAKNGNFDLIIMPTHAGYFRRLLLGSTTAKVLDGADCPLITTQRAETLGPQPAEHRKWVCAIGLSSDSERVLNMAKSASLVAQAKLSIIHVMQENKRKFVPGRPCEQEQIARRQLADLQNKVGVDAATPVRIAIGPIKETLLHEVSKESADVLVIGRSLQGTGRLRDLAYSLVRDSPCPVVSV